MQGLQAVADLRSQVQENIGRQALIVGLAPLQQTRQIDAFDAFLDDISVLSIDDPFNHSNQVRMVKAKQIPYSQLQIPQASSIRQYVGKYTPNHNFALAGTLKGAVVALGHTPCSQLANKGDRADRLGKKKHR
jgi:hypothetical protein